MEFRHDNFNNIPLHTFYAILRLRSEVFVVEQNCIWLDVDGHDQKAIHIWAGDENGILAYSRIMKAGDYYNEASIGRVVVGPAYRMKGAGHALMNYTLTLLHKLYGVQPVKIMAQAYLRKFYEQYGFVVCSDQFDDCGIMHYYMMKY